MMRRVDFFESASSLECDSVMVGLWGARKTSPGLGEGDEVALVPDSFGGALPEAGPNPEKDEELHENDGEADGVVVHAMDEEEEAEEEEERADEADAEEEPAQAAEVVTHKCGGARQAAAAADFPFGDGDDLGHVEPEAEDHDDQQDDQGEDELGPDAGHGGKGFIVDGASDFLEDSKKDADGNHTKQEEADQAEETPEISAGTLEKFAGGESGVAPIGFENAAGGEEQEEEEDEGIVHGSGAGFEVFVGHHVELDRVGNVEGIDEELSGAETGVEHGAHARGDVVGGEAGEKKGHDENPPDQPLAAPDQADACGKRSCRLIVHRFLGS